MCDSYWTEALTDIGPCILGWLAGLEADCDLCRVASILSADYFEHLSAVGLVLCNISNHEIATGL